MKRFTIATLVLVGLALVAGSALAGKKHHRGKENAGAAKADMPRKAPKAHIAMLTKKLGLSEEQAAKVKDIFKAHHEAAKARKEQLHKNLATVLNEEQMAKFKKFQKMRKGHGKFQRGRGGMFAGLDLTDEQKQQIAEICKEAHTKTMAVLTDQQRQKLQKCREKGKKTGGKRWGKGGDLCPMIMKDGKAECPLMTTDKPADKPTEE